MCPRFGYALQPFLPETIHCSRQGRGTDSSGVQRAGKEGDPVVGITLTVGG